MNALEIFGYKNVDEVIKLGIREADRRKRELLKKNHPDNGGSGDKIREVKEAYCNIAKCIEKFAESDSISVIDAEELNMLYNKGFGFNDLKNFRLSVSFKIQKFSENNAIDAITKIEANKVYRFNANIVNWFDEEIGIVFNNDRRVVTGIGKKETLTWNVGQIKIILDLYID